MVTFYGRSSRRRWPGRLAIVAVGALHLVGSVYKVAVQFLDCRVHVAHPLLEVFGLDIEKISEFEYRRLTI